MRLCAKPWEGQVCTLTIPAHPEAPLSTTALSALPAGNAPFLTPLELGAAQCLMILDHELMKPTDWLLNLGSIKNLCEIWGTLIKFLALFFAHR
jgi:hypothetical protein